jgi:hypothetical protein
MHLQENYSCQCFDYVGDEDAVDPVDDADVVHDHAYLHRYSA